LRFAGINHCGVNVFHFVAEIFDNGTVKNRLLDNQHFNFFSQIWKHNIVIKSDDSREFVDTFLLICGDSLLQQRLNHDTTSRDLTESGYESRTFTAWFLFTIINTEIWEQFYGEDSSVRLRVRVGFIINIGYRVI
jgi:hypothetical protein